MDYVFDAPQQVLIFDRSSGDYRTGSWTPLDEGVRLERLRGTDTLVFDRPTAHARFRVTPYGEAVPYDRTPWLRFSNGDVAIYTGQFNLLPVESRKAALDLNGQLSGWHGSQPRVGVRVISDRPMLSEGKLATGESDISNKGDGTYVFIGSEPLVEAPDCRSVIDSGLPPWIGTSFSKDLSGVFATERALWGDGLVTKSTVLLAFNGYDGAWQNNGSVMGSVLAMRVSGAEYRNPDERLRYSLIWFFAHEVTHLFQFRSGHNLANGADKWIIEGSADAMAYRVLEYMGTIDHQRRETEVKRAYERCVWSLGQGPLREAHRRNQDKADYDCGLIIAEITDKALSKADFFAFWNALLKSDPGPTFDADLYFKVMADLGAPADIVDLLRSVPGAPPDRSVAALNEAMTKSGLAPKFDGKGTPKALDLP